MRPPVPPAASDSTLARTGSTGTTGLAARPGLLPDVLESFREQPDSGPYCQAGQSRPTVEEPTLNDDIIIAHGLIGRALSRNDRARGQPGRSGHRQAPTVTRQASHTTRAHGRGSGPGRFLTHHGHAE